MRVGKRLVTGEKKSRIQSKSAPRRALHAFGKVLCMQPCVRSALQRSLLRFSAAARPLSNRRLPNAVHKVSVDSLAEERMHLAVCGLHMRGQKLEHQLTDLGAAFVKACRSSPVYELYAITDPANHTCKPGMVAVGKAKGKAIELEIWDLPVQRLGDLFLQISEPLGLGTVCLDDQSKVKEFICEGYIADLSSQASSKDSPFESSIQVENITQYGSWKQYKAQQQQI